MDEIDSKVFEVTDAHVQAALDAYLDAWEAIPIGVSRKHFTMRKAIEASGLTSKLAALEKSRDHWLREAQRLLKSGQDCVDKLAALEDENKRLREEAQKPFNLLDHFTHPQIYDAIREATLGVEISIHAFLTALSKPAALPAEGKGESEAEPAVTVHVYESATCNGRKMASIRNFDNFIRSLPLGDHSLYATPPAPQPLEGAVKVDAVPARIEWRKRERTFPAVEEPWSVVDYHTGLLIQQHPEKYETRPLYALSAPSLSPAPQPVGEVTDDMVRKAGDVLLYQVNAPEQVIYAAARLALTAALASASPSPAAQEDGTIECHGLDTPERVCFYEQDFYVLSNFSSFRVRWKGRNFDTSEAAYHWEKFPDRANIQFEIEMADSAHEAFKYAERMKAHRRPDWDEVKVDIMRDILRTKAEQHEYVRRKLLATGDRELVENSWRDDFWGWGPNRDGKNMLGMLWMEVRAELRAAAQEDGI